VAFRVFDIWKPWPIRRLEHLRPVGVGIMFDDLLAGVMAGLLTLGGWLVFGAGG
jgi:phosphatidylglycerophosphatase A